MVKKKLFNMLVFIIIMLLQLFSIYTSNLLLIFISFIIIIVFEFINYRVSYIMKGYKLLKEGKITNLSLNKLDRLVYNLLLKDLVKGVVKDVKD